MDAALASVLSAALGGVIGSGSTLMLDARRAKGRELEESARDRLELRRTARLLSQELEAAKVLIDASRERGKWAWEPPNRSLSTQTWTDYRSLFARHAGVDDWRATANAYRECDRLNWRVKVTIDEAALMNIDVHPLEGYPTEESDRIGDAAAAVESALAVLRAQADAAA